VGIPLELHKLGGAMISREEAYQLVTQKVKQKNLVKHILAVEAVMRALAEHLGEDVEFWGLTGLLHDLDYSVTADHPEKHSYVTREWLKDYNIPDEMMHAINAHPGHIPCETKLDWALYCSDPVTGLIVAGVLMHPSKKLANIDVGFMLRRFKEKRFAAGADREAIAKCEKLGLSLEEFMNLALKGMRSISDELGF
jgi:putative nucleotidyltransferase with HDIG domain